MSIHRQLKKFKLSKFFIAILVIAGIWIVIDQILLLSFQLLNFPQHYNKSYVPYVEFLNQQYNDQNYELGYRDKVTPKSTDSLKIAFFGGSTLYGGSTTIPELVRQKLEHKTDKAVEVANFSVVSHNHRQNTHNLIENYFKFSPDITIFYGGFNDTIQTAYYDPRPGYPYNYYYSHETNPIIKFLIQNTATAYLLELVGNKYNLFSLTPLSDLRKHLGYMSPSWKESLITNYFESIESAKIFTLGTYSSHCQNSGQFRFFYQPFQVPNNMFDVHNKIRDIITTRYNYGFDISTILDGHEHIYTDIVHISQDGNEVVADAMVKFLMQDKKILACMSK